MLLSPTDLRAALFADPKGEHAEKFFQLPSDAAARIDAQVGFIWSQACTGKFVWPLPDKGLKKHIHRIAAPTLIVWGEADGIVAPAYAEESRGASRMRASRCWRAPGICRISSRRKTSRSWSENFSALEEPGRLLTY